MSGDKDDFGKRLREIDYNGDGAVAEKLRKEAQQTLDYQIQSLNDIDTKASKILRINVLLIGVLLSALSIAARDPSVEVADFINIYTKVGVLSLILSTATAAWTYTASDYDVGISPENIADSLERELTKYQFEMVMAKSYARWIDFNNSTNIRNVPLITATNLLVVTALIFLTLGVYQSLVDTVSDIFIWGSVLIIVTITLVSKFPWQLRDALEDIFC